MTTDANYLLYEREKILKELKAVEALLESRYGWGGSSTALQIVGFTHKDTVTIPESEMAIASIEEQIPYSEEFRKWLESVTGEFTITHFRKFMQSKYGNRINDNSLRTPIHLAEKETKIVKVAPGSGRRPTTYMKLEDWL